MPQILSQCFWGGLYGVVFGIVYPRLRPPMWLNGLVLGLGAALVLFFVVAPIKHQPIGGGWVLTNWIRSILINGSFGVGVGIIYSYLSGLVFSRAGASRA